MIRRLLAFLGRFVAVVLLGVVGLVGFSAVISINDPVLIVIIACIIAVCAYFIRRTFGILSRPLQDVDKWFSIGSAVLLWMVAAWGLNSEYREYRQPLHTYPAFNELQVSSGYLRYAHGGAFYITRVGQPDLRMTCAGVYGGRGRGRSCDYASEMGYVDKYVTVFHTAPRKSVLWKANYYEMRSGDVVVVSYDRIVGTMREVELRHRSIDYGFWVLLFIWGLYIPLEYAIRRYRQNKRLKPLDEPVTATQ